MEPIKQNVRKVIRVLSIFATAFAAGAPKERKTLEINSANHLLAVIKVESNAVVHSDRYLFSVTKAKNR